MNKNLFISVLILMMVACNLSVKPKVEDRLTSIKAEKLSDSLYRVMKAMEDTIYITTIIDGDMVLKKQKNQK